MPGAATAHNGAYVAPRAAIGKTVFEMAVNMKMAKALGITIPRPVVMEADKVIE